MESGGFERGELPRGVAARSGSPFGVDCILKERVPEITAVVNV